MPKKPESRFTPPLDSLLDSEQPVGDSFFEFAESSGPALSEKESSIFRTSKFTKKLGYLIRRRTTDEGQLLSDGLTDAQQQMQTTLFERAVFEAAPAATGFNWVSIGPRNINGRIKCLAIHPTDGDIVYAGAANGGVWKTTNGGRNWRPTMHDEESLAIGAIAIDPSAPDVVYAGTGEPVYLLSGSSPLPPGSANLAWYYEGVGVYRSNDGGVTWLLTGDIENRFVYGLAVDPFDSDHLLCAGFSSTVGEGGLCRSTDGGASWTTVEQGVFSAVRFDPVNRGVAYAAQHNGGIHKSTNGGLDWSTRNQGLPSPLSMGRINLTVAAANPDVLYAKIENDATGELLGIFRTTSAAEAPGWTAVSDAGVDRGFLWWCSYIVADPADTTGNRLFAGGLNVALSEDGGQTWDLATDAYEGTRMPTHADNHDLVFDPTDTNRVYIANDGGVFRGAIGVSTDPVQWTKASFGLAVTQFYDMHASRVSPSLVGGGAQDNGSLLSTGGLSWRSIFGGDGGYVAFHPTDPHTVWVQSQNANIVRSTDGGNGFLPANIGINSSGGVFPATVFAIDRNNPDILFAGTDRVYRTTTGGVSPFFFLPAWSAASNVIGPVTEIAIAPSSSGIIYAGNIRGRLFRSVDGGVTSSSFQDITPAVGGWPRRWLSGIAVHPTDANRIYVSFLGFNGSAENASDHVWRGDVDPATGNWTWQLIADDLPDVPVGAIVVDSANPAEEALYIATDIGVFRSLDGGSRWDPFENGLPNVPVVDLALDEENRVLRCATHGRGMFQVNLANPGARVDLFVRDNVLDTGVSEPSPSDAQNPISPGNVVDHHRSVDIKVDAAPFHVVDTPVDGASFDNPEHPYIGFGHRLEEIEGVVHSNPLRGRTNRVYVQVHNRGWDRAGDVTVKLLYADLDAGLPPLPDDFWVAFPGDGFDTTEWRPIGTQTVHDLLPATPQVAVFDWDLPATASNLACLLVLVDSADDPLTPQTELDADELTRNNKRVAQRIVEVIEPPVG